MRWFRLLARIFGWLLTPFLAWAASFFGATIGALVAARLTTSNAGLIATALGGAIAGFTAIILWLRFLRRSPELREVLAVTEEGTPDTATMTESEAEPTPEPAAPTASALPASPSAHP